MWLPGVTGNRIPECREARLREDALEGPRGHGDGHGYLPAEGTWAGGVNHACLPLAFLPPLPVRSQPVITVFMVRRW